MSNKTKVYSCIRIIVYIIAIALIVFIVNGKITTNCYWNDNYGFKCPTCGMTRATISLFKFNIKEAIGYNLFYTCILFPIAFALIVNDLWIITARFISKKDKLSIIEKMSGINGKGKRIYSVFFIILFIAFITYGILRNFV